MDKKIIPMIDLDSNDFVKKVLYSLDEADGVGTVIPSMGGRDLEMQNFLFLLMNTRPSQRKKCKACNGYHWHFVKEFETKENIDAGMLCSSCGSILVLMSMLEVDKDKTIEWIKSEGKINPFDLLRDAVDKLIKEGKIKVDVQERK